MNQNHRIKAFHQLHESGCFVLPNPWDRGSAIVLASMGFKALATSSAALAFVEGTVDAPTSIGLNATLSNIEAIVQATDVPVNADFQSGYGSTLDAIHANVQRCIETGVAGLSIEDATGDTDQPLFVESEALERVRAAHAAIDEGHNPVVLTARCEAFLVGDPNPLETVLTRLVAFADAGADCLFAPGLQTPEQVSAVVAAVAPKPVNVLATDPSWMTVASLAELGVRRISVGSALARAAWNGFLTSAQDIATTGSFESLQNATPFQTLNDMFASHR